MAHALQRIVFVSRAGIDVDTNAGKMAREGFGGDAEAIGKGCDFIEVGRILQTSADVFRQAGGG